MSDDQDMAVALKYDKEKDGAPRVVAKGMRLKAEKIRAIAKANNVPLMRNVNLANALYRATGKRVYDQPFMNNLEFPG